MGSYVTKIFGDPPYPQHYAMFGRKGGYFEKSSYGSEISDMTLEGLGEVFKGDSADRCAGNSEEHFTSKS